MKIKTSHVLSLALFSTSLAGCPFSVNPWPEACPPWGHHCQPPTTTDAQPPTTDAQNGTDCAELVVQNPGVSLAGIAMYQPDQKRNNPSAGEPWYVYLASGKEGVILPGAGVASAAGLFTLQSPSITMIKSAPTAAPDGYVVVVNPSLKYNVAISDFEYEVGLARVELCERNGKIESRFLFRGEPGADGVAHAITITATANGVASAPTSPVTVEVRQQ